MKRDLVKHIFLVLGLGMANLNVEVIAENRDLSFRSEIFNRSPRGFQTVALKLSDSSSNIDFNDLPFNQSIKVVKGNGLKKVAVFYEIDCAYCKSLAKYELSRIDDVTIYNFVFVNENKNSASWKKAESIWCANDINMAWNDFITKDYLVKNLKSCENPLDKNKMLALRLGVKGTPTLFFSNGTKAVGVLKAKEIEQRFLDASFYND
jgi:thiol:disulfide interchange protein DsbC